MATTTAGRVRAAERRDLEEMLRQRVAGEVRFDPFSGCSTAPTPASTRWSRWVW